MSSKAAANTDRLPAPTKEMILDAAAEVLARDGLSGYNTNAIAAKGNIATGTLYSHFPSKGEIRPIDQITLELLRRQRSRIEPIFGAKAECPNRENVIKAAIKACLTLFLYKPDLVGWLDLEDRRMAAPAPFGVRALIQGKLLEVFSHHSTPNFYDNELAADLLMELMMGMSLAAVRAGSTRNKLAIDQIKNAVLGFIDGPGHPYEPFGAPSLASSLGFNDFAARSSG